MLSVSPTLPSARLRSQLEEAANIEPLRVLSKKLFDSVEFKRLCLPFLDEDSSDDENASEHDAEGTRQSNMAEEDNLVTRRPKRSTAGNRCVLLSILSLPVAHSTVPMVARMEVALAELALEEPQEPEEDVEFIDDKGTFFSFTPDLCRFMSLDRGRGHI